MSASNGDHPAAPHLGHFLVLAVVLVAVCAFGTNTAACPAAGAIVALAPFVWRPLFGRPRSEGVVVAEPFVVAIAIFALRSVLGPPSWWLSAAMLLSVTILTGWLARVRLRRWKPRTLRPGVYVPVMAVMAACVPVGWIVEHGHLAIGQSPAWDSLERVQVRGPYDPAATSGGAPSVKCPGPAAGEPPNCPYVLDGHDCLSVERDIDLCFVVDCTPTETCPLIEARRTPGSRTLVATRSRQQGPNGWGSPSLPYVVTRGKFGTLASPFVMGATAPPPSWLWTSLVGVVVCTAQLLWLGRSRRRLAQRPPEGPYRVPSERSDPPADLSVDLRHARLVLLATALPVLVALGATLARGLGIG